MNYQLLLARAGPGDMSGQGETRDGVQVTEVEAGMDMGALADNRWRWSCLHTYAPHPEAQTLRVAGWGSVSSSQGHSRENKFKYFHYSHINTS